MSSLCVYKTTPLAVLVYHVLIHVRAYCVYVKMCTDKPHGLSPETYKILLRCIRNVCMNQSVVSNRVAHVV